MFRTYTTDIFERGLRKKLRFNFKGSINIETLYDLSVNNLDAIYKELMQQKRNTVEDTLLSVSKEKDETLELQLEIVKHIVQVKLEEQRRKEEEMEVKAQKQLIRGIIKEKENENLKNMPISELKRML